MKIAFCAFDVGPGKNHALVANEAAERGHVVTMHVNGTRGELDVLAAKPDVLVTAVSSFKGETEEIPVGLRAADLGIPWVVFCDSHETWARPPMKEHAAKAAAVLVAHPDEIPLAIEWGYRHAEFIGYPPLWGQFLRGYSTDRIFDLWNKITIQKNNRECFRGNVLAVVGGTKQPELTNRMIDGTIMALQSTIGDHFAVAPLFHPREDPPKDSAERKRILEGVRLADTSALRTIEPLI